MQAAKSRKFYSGRPLNQTKASRAPNLRPPLRGNVCVRRARVGRVGWAGGKEGGGSLGGSRVGVDCNALIIFALDPTEQPAVGVVFCV